MPGKCNNCDNCLNPKTEFEGKDYIVKVLETILAVKEKFKADHIANILAGVKTAAVKAYKHHHLELFGYGKDKDVKFWNTVVRQALIARFITKEIENYGLLKIENRGLQYLKSPTSFILSADNNYEEVEDEDIMATAQARATALDEELFNMLKDLRKKISKQKQVPPFVIFQDPSLEDMSFQYPINLDELQNISGVGVGKAKRYGKEFVELIKRYVEEKEILRPQDLVVKSVVNKSGLKVYIIQSIDRKISLSDIAEAKGLEMGQLLDEIEAIINSGTKLNIDYFINEIMELDRQEEIFNYFREEAESESISEALEFLGEDEYTEFDIRLIRIKFISELGN
jgi:ATP-dependent DNA helicase RecQ